MYPLGIAVENADTTAGDTTVVVDLLEPIVVEYYANAAAGGAIAATDMWELCYFSDYGTVSKTASAGCVAGIIVDYDATKGVGVCHRRNVHGTSGSIGG
jgi:hypothetical protein